MEQIRQRAREGLMAAPRVGMGVGGLLLGVRKGTRIRLLDSIDIPCSHSAGPAFDLTADEKRESREMIAEAGTPGVSRKVGAIGWYCSKTRDDANLNQSDLNLYNELFPAPWQVALVVRPDVVETMRAAFFFRDESGAVVKAVECEVDEWRPSPAESAPETKTATIPVEPPPVLSKPVLSNPMPAQPVLAKPAETRLPDTGDLFSLKAAAAGPVARQISARPPASFFGLSPRLRRNNVRPALQISAALLALVAAAFMTRGFWMPKPPLTLNSTELNGTLLIRWNPEALRGVDHASMFVNDGGQRTPSLIPLDRLQLNSGLLSYTPKSQRVTAKLDAGETSAITAWFAAATPAPATPAPAPSSDGKANK
jgi:hypothetical protein